MITEHFTMQIYWSEDDLAFIVAVPELSGCMADGSTRQEAIANAEIIIQEWLEINLENKGSRISTYANP